LKAFEENVMNKKRMDKGPDMDRAHKGLVPSLTQEKFGPNGDKIYTFSYQEVVSAAKIRLNAHLN
jgi:hypothetical protein